MTSKQRIDSFLTRFPVAGAIAYFALIVTFAAVSADSVRQVLQARNAMSAASEILERIDVRGAARTPEVRTDVSVPAGTPFLEGQSPSIAGAALLQRITAATKRNGGNTLSSQVDLNGPSAKAGLIRATSSFEIEPLRLQPLLYDLEAGMPFLFVDELVIQAPTASAEGGKLRVLLGVSGQRLVSR